MKVKMSTSMGDIELELDADKAPVTVENFKQYASEGHYDGTIFHRVISNFMIQGGGLSPEMTPKQTHDPIQNEAENGLPNVRGSIAMARLPAPHSATSQFFINVTDNDFLNFSAPNERGFGYCVFGKVTDGMDTVDAIRAVKTGIVAGYENVPLEPVMIEKVEILE